MFDKIKNKKYLLFVNNELIYGFDTKKEIKDFISRQKKYGIYSNHDIIEIIEREKEVPEAEGWV